MGESAGGGQDHPATFAVARPAAGEMDRMDTEADGISNGEAVQCSLPLWVERFGTLSVHLRPTSKRASHEAKSCSLGPLYFSVTRSVNLTDDMRRPLTTARGDPNSPHV